MHSTILKLFFLFLFLWGCSTVHDPHQQSSRKVLAIQLMELDEKISYHEAQDLSSAIFQRSAVLDQMFERTGNPYMHNFLVNIGLKKKGLCYHYSDGLYSYLKQKNYSGFEFHLVGANIGDYWREHNALVVVAKGQKVMDGIVVDPWRDERELYFSKISEDRTYEWKHRIRRGCY
ncbi:hypothetical protein ACM66Z_01950 [Sulfurovum sp. ST-21]|uniref:Transglutaminase-like domain-containing protein n=1 Tax=Sulfurovum indicum TaxID=2779528 RepID=A0A7M1S5J9_9BACT|nr:hypothetical protein [Sulfurovum indicum]QOR62261.1 hypothetical protein IMZ28_01940 [Sulfurovum indicum]